jgi:hypothetical protein
MALSGKESLLGKTAFCIDHYRCKEPMAFLEREKTAF